jgi:DNA repair photolyase
MNRAYNTPLGLTSQFSFCGLPLRLDTYAGCAISCSYCFARLRGGNAQTNKIRYADPNSVITRFKNAFSKPEVTTGVVAELVRNKTPLHFGGMSDPFQPIENKEKASLKLLKYLASIQYPTVISTKSALVSSPEYVDVLKENKNLVVQFSFSTIDDQLAGIVEPHSNKPTQLLKTITVLSINGIKTTVRWQPFIPSFSEEPAEFVHKVSTCGIKHVGLEHLKLPLERKSPLWMKLSSTLDFDIKKYYLNSGAKNDGRELVLPAEFKILVAKKVKEETRKRQLTFGSADNDIQYLSDNNCCCSGVDQFEGFENWNKFQIAYAVKKSNGGNITIDLISNEWRPKGAINKYLNSHSRIELEGKHAQIDDYIFDRWENLDSPFNPTRFHRVINSEKRDAKGFRIYEWAN